MSRLKRFEPEPIFEALGRHGVRFVLIGGLAGAARGVGWPTFDADVVVEDSEENITRLWTALAELGAEYDTFHQPPIRPELRMLRSAPGPQLFVRATGGSTFSRRREARRTSRSWATRQSSKSTEPRCRAPAWRPCSE